MTIKPTAALILLIQEDGPEAAAVREAFGQQPDALARLQWVERLPTALARLAGGGVDAILLDIAPGGAGDRLDGFLQLREFVPGIPIVVRCGADDEGLALRAMRAGAADYVHTQMGAGSLPQVLRAAVERNRNAAGADRHAMAPPTGRGGIIAVLGAKGGVGTTTLALNVAAEMARRNRVILAEIQPAFGTLALYFKPHSAKRNLADLLRGPAPGPEQAQACLWRYDGLPGLSLLFSPQTPEQCREIAPLRAQAILKTLTEMADYVIVDLPASLSEANREVIENTDYLALVAERDPVCIHTAGQIARTLKASSRAPRSLGTVIVNRAVVAAPMELEEIGEQLGSAPLGVIPAEPDLCLRAQTAHAPLVKFLPESAMAEKLIALAARLEPAGKAAA